MKTCLKRFCALLICCAIAMPFCSFDTASSASEVTSFTENSSVVSSTLILTTDSDFNAASLENAFTGCDYRITYSDDLFTIMDVTAGADSFRACRTALRSVPGVTAVEEDGEVSLTAVNDYFYDTQYYLDNTGSYTQITDAGSKKAESTAGIDLDIPKGWELFRNTVPDARSVTIAVIDTGIDYKHPDLTDSMWINEGEIPDNGIDDDGNGYIDDVYGWDFYNGDASVCHYEYSSEYGTYLSSPKDCDDHGTHVAGIIGATADNSIGIAGITACADVSLMSLKIHGGSDRHGSISNAVKAIRYAQRMGADVCNISWGSYEYSSALYTAMASSTMLFVCSAGNDGTDNDERPLYPASFDLDNIISVGFTDENGTLAFDSNYGRSSVDVVVPATHIFSTIVGTYSTMSGSSMAAPQVSGLAALMYTIGEGFYASNVRKIIMSGVKPLDNFERITVAGGIPSLERLVVLSYLLRSDLEPPKFSTELTFTAGELKLEFTTEDEGGSGVNSIRYLIGKKDAEDFANGTAGTVVTGNVLKLSKAGCYTFCVTDNSGNSTIRTYRLMDDIVAPKITRTGYTVSPDRKTITVTAKITDNLSGVKTVKYLPGVHSASDFKGSSVPTCTLSDDYISFTVREEGTYTIYAQDTRGNASTVVVMAYIRKSTKLRLSRSKVTLEVGEDKKLTARLTPKRSTDTVEFSSSDPSVATVDEDGRVTAVSPGRAEITATTPFGIADSCTIIVSGEPEAEVSAEDASPEN